MNRGAPADYILIMKNKANFQNSPLLENAPLGGSRPLWRAKKYCLLNGISALNRCTYSLSGTFSLDFFARFGYDMDYGIETRDLLAWFSRGSNDPVLLRNLDSVCIQQEANPVSGHCELYRFVLTAPTLLQANPSRPSSGGFFCEHGSLKRLTRPRCQIKLTPTKKDNGDPKT